MNEREKKLLLFFGGAIFIMANLYGWFEWLAARNRETNRQVGLEKSIANSKKLLTLKPQAEEYNTMVSEWLVRYPDFDTRDTYLGNFVQKAAGDMGVSLSKNQPTATEGLKDTPDGEAPKFIKTGYTGEVSGDWKKVIEFAHQLEDTTEFRWLKSADFKVRKADGESGSDLVLSFTVQKWWDPSSEYELTQTEGEGADAEPANATETNSSEAPKDTEQAPTPAVPTTAGEPAPAPPAAEGPK